IYVNGESQEIEILFDELNTHLGAKEPFRIGAGGGPENRFHGYIDEVRVYNRALSPDEAAVLPVLDTATQIAAIPPARRSPAQAGKVAHCFVETAAPDSIQRARQELLSARVKRQQFYERIPSVMVMQKAATPRETFVLRRGAYDAPGE